MSRVLIVDRGVGLTEKRLGWVESETLVICRRVAVGLPPTSRGCVNLGCQHYKPHTAVSRCWEFDRKVSHGCSVCVPVKNTERADALVRGWELRCRIEMCSRSGNQNTRGGGGS